MFLTLLIPPAPFSITWRKGRKGSKLPSPRSGEGLGVREEASFF
jgi:hypothetical protein